jgi:hypothetical protein
MRHPLHRGSDLRLDCSEWPVDARRDFALGQPTKIRQLE